MKAALCPCLMYHSVAKAGLETECLVRVYIYFRAGLRRNNDNSHLENFCSLSFTNYCEKWSLLRLSHENKGASKEILKMAACSFIHSGYSWEDCPICFRTRIQKWDGCQRSAYWYVYLNWKMKSDFVWQKEFSSSWLVWKYQPALPIRLYGWHFPNWVR